MIEDCRIELQPGLVFDVSVAGSPEAPLVLMLHGFAVSRHLYDAQLPAVAAAGLLAVAPNQRGYSPGARPDPAHFANYDIELLIGDALALVAAMSHVLLPPKERAGQVVRMARMNCLGDLYPRARWGWTSL